MKTAILAFLLAPLLAFGGVTTGPVGGASNTTVTNIVNAQLAATGVVTSSNFPVSRIATNTYNLQDFGTDGRDFEVFNHALAITNNTSVNVGWGNFNQSYSNAMIVFIGADTNRGNFVTRITSVNSPTNIGIADPVPFSYYYQYADTNIQTFPYGYPVVVITNSSHLAIQAWVNQRTNGLNGDWMATAGRYAITNAPQFTNQNNAQIIIPSPSLLTRTNDINNNPVFIMEGAGPIAPGFYSANGELTIPKNATVFFSTWKGDGWKGTNRTAFSVFNFSPYDGTAVGYNHSSLNLPINAVKPILKNFWLYQEYDPDGVGINAQGTFEGELHDVLIGCFMYPWFCPEPRHTNGWAYIGSGDYCGNGATSTHCQMWGYNSLIDLGIGNFLDFTLGVAHNGFTSIIGGSTAENHIDNIQFTCVNKWIAGSGPICNATNDPALGVLPSFAAATPKMTVNSYQNQILPGATPAWMNPNPAPIYDLTNYVCNYSVGARAGWVTYPDISQAGAGAIPVQGPREGIPGLAITMNFFALPHRGSTNYESRNFVYYGTQLFTNSVTLTGTELHQGNVTFSNGFTAGRLVTLSNLNVLAGSTTTFYNNPNFSGAVTFSSDLYLSGGSILSFGGDGKGYWRSGDWTVKNNGISAGTETSAGSGNILLTGTVKTTGTTTNVVGTTVKGQWPVSINGETFYIDLKQ